MLTSIDVRRSRIAAFTASRARSVGEFPASREDTVSSIFVYPLQEPVSKRHYTVLKLLTKSGLSGYGECAQISADELGQATNAIVGMPITAFEVLRNRLQAVPG